MKVSRRKKNFTYRSLVTLELDADVIQLLEEMGKDTPEKINSFMTEVMRKATKKPLQRNLLNSAKITVYI